MKRTRIETDGPIGALILLIGIAVVCFAVPIIAAGVTP